MSRKPIIQDPISALIREQGVRIRSVHVIKDANLLLVVLNHGRLELPLNSFRRLADATPSQLQKYELLPDGAGVQWPSLDEHLSLRGFLLDKMRDMLHQGYTGGSQTKAALAR